MAEYNKTILTNQGLELMRKANAGKAKFTITKVAGSSENLSQKNQDEIKKLTSITDVKQMGVIKDIEGTALDDNTVAALKLTFDNRNLKDAYDLNTVAIYAKEEGKDEILYAVSTAKSAEHFPSFSNKVLFTFEILLYLVIGQMDLVTVNVSPEKVEEQIKKVKKDLEDKIATAGKVKTVNQVEPDSSGNIALDPSISIIKNYNFDTDSATSEYHPLSQAHVIGRDVLADIKNKLNSVKADLDKKITDEKNSTYSKTEIDSKVAQAGKVKTVDGINPDTNGNIDISNKIDEPINKLKTDLETQINSKANQADLNTVKNTAVKSVAGVKPDNRGNVPITEFNLSVDFNSDEDLRFNFFKNSRALNGNIQIPGIQTVAAILNQIASNISSINSLYDTTDRLDKKIKESSTKITSNTNRIDALEKKETSHISPSETDALNYSKSHPGIPVFVAE